MRTGSPLRKPDTLLALIDRIDGALQNRHQPTRRLGITRDEHNDDAHEHRAAAGSAAAGSAVAGSAAAGSGEKHPATGSRVAQSVKQRHGTRTPPGSNLSSPASCKGAAAACAAAGSAGGGSGEQKPNALLDASEVDAVRKAVAGEDGD